LDNPAISGSNPDDPFWLNRQFNSLVGPLFDTPRNIDYMLEHNAVNILLTSGSAKLDSIRTITFHIHTGFSETVTNLGRNVQLIDSMAAKDIFNTVPNLILASNAVHDYGFADLHASKTLIKHWETFQQATSVHTESETVPVPVTAELLQNYPNPFNPTTHIRYHLERASRVQITVYSIRGEKIKTLVRATQAVGEYQVAWDGMNDRDMKVSSGLYIYQLKTNSFSQTRKMLLLK